MGRSVEEFYHTPLHIMRDTIAGYLAHQATERWIVRRVAALQLQAWASKGRVKETDIFPLPTDPRPSVYSMSKEVQKATKARISDRDRAWLDEMNKQKQQADNGT